MRRLMTWRICGAFLLVLLLFLQLTLTAIGAPKVIYQYASKNGKARVALSFDDGPHPKYTPQILDILKEFEVPATFFAVGVNAESYPALIKRIRDEGHELGNHTCNHYHVPKLSAQELARDIESCSSTIERIAGKAPRFFRPPEGICNQHVKEICEKQGMTIVLWSIDTRDWAHTPIDEICRNVRSNVKNGSIILMHDFIGANSPTPQALRQIVPMLKELGYEFVTISQLLED